MSEEDQARITRWRDHCYRMAEATHALADWCEEHEMMDTYLKLAARWISMAQNPPHRPT